MLNRFDSYLLPTMALSALANNKDEWLTVSVEKIEGDTIFLRVENEPYLWAIEIEVLKNTFTIASWYFLNKIDFVACIEGVITFEDYSNIKEVK